MEESACEPFSRSLNKAIAYRSFMVEASGRIYDIEVFRIDNRRRAVVHRGNVRYARTQQWPIRSGRRSKIQRSGDSQKPDSDGSPNHNTR